jgi:ACR3 family arsenite efflux pump ArsB
MLLTTYIQDESTKTLVLITIVCLVIGFFTVKWLIHSKKEAEEKNEYYSIFQDYRLLGILMILLIGTVANIIELIKRC